MEWSRLIFLIFMCFAHILECKAQGHCQHPCMQNEKCIQKKYQNTCFYLFQDYNRTWQENSDFCRDKDMKMVKITPELLHTLQHPMFDHQKYKSSGVWLAGKASNHGSWKFLNNTSTDMLERKSGLDAKGNHIEYCGIFNSQNFGYRADSCGSNRSSLCRFDINGRFQNVKVIREEKRWFEARTHCIQTGGDLFYMRQGDNEDEMREHIEKEIRNANIKDGRSLHVGVVRRLWQWNDESQILHTNWGSGEPSNGSETCLMMYGTTGLWNDAVCSSRMLTLCQKDTLNPTTPTTVPTVFFSKASTTTSSAQPVAGSKSSTTSSSRNMDEQPHERTFNTESSPSVYGEGEESSNTGSNTDKLTIILGVLLGVFFLTTILLLIFILCKRKKKSDEETNVTPESPYTETFSNGMTPASVVAANSQSHNTGHQQQNGLSRAQENEYIMDEDQGKPAASPKPHIKPKPVIGPKTGDVYATVDRHVTPSHDNQDAHVYDNRTT